MRLSLISLLLYLALAAGCDVNREVNISPIPTLPLLQSPLPTPELVLWRMDSPYGDVLPNFTVLYDATAWEMQDEQIHARTAEQCILGRGGAIGADTLATANLAGFIWNISNTNDPAIVQYGMNWGSGGYIFYLKLPEPYTTEHKSWCQEQAEAIIHTFMVVDDGDK